MYLKLIMGSTNCTVVKHMMFVDYDIIFGLFSRDASKQNYNLLYKFVNCRSNTAQYEQRKQENCG